ncbi:hypothetical protein ACFFWC_27495 [Plantactinospora siamensis]|uniref:Right handed beta helix domain-containing protein n=1 Tax=Plantactinospora siamensis TaxID=555372 RepID=A0ABV6NXZ8_9ACTN
MSTIHPGPSREAGRSLVREWARPILFGALVALCLALVVSGAFLASGGNRAPVAPHRRAATDAPAPLPEPPPSDAAPPDLVPGATPPTPISYWPGPTTTGVPAGTVLRNQTGTLNLRTAGQIVTNLNLTGCVNVYASNVQILKSRITCNSTTFAIRVITGAVKLLVQDVEVNGSGLTAAAICCSDVTVNRSNVYNTIDAIRLGNNTTVINSYIHGLMPQPGSHNDTLQTTGGTGILVQHNRLEPYNAALKNPFNACIMIGSEQAPAVINLLFTDNYCDGGNYSIGVRTDLVATNVRLTKCKYGRDFRYGIIARPNQTGIYFERSTNVWFDNGLPVLP